MPNPRNRLVTVPLHIVTVMTLDQCEKLSSDKFGVTWPEVIRIIEPRRGFGNALNQVSNVT